MMEETVVLLGLPEAPHHGRGHRGRRGLVWGPTAGWPLSRTRRAAATHGLSKSAFVVVVRRVVIGVVSL